MVYQKARDYRTMQQKREAAREKMETVKSYRLIENSIILNPSIMGMLKEIAIEQGSGLTYSDSVAFLVKYYRSREKSQYHS